jgi:ribonuclease E
MLINAQRADHLRVAIVKGTQLEDFHVDIAEAGLTRGNIYRGVVANLQPSLNAAFVDIGEDRHAFLPVGDVLPAAFHRKPPEGERRPRVDQVLDRGKSILVQVAKDGVGQKGAALTTNLALAGRYLVLTPFDDVRGISRKAEADDERKKARERLGRLDAPDDFGVIIRTNGLDQNQTTLNRDLNALLRLWRRIRSEGAKGRGPRLLYSDQDLVVQALRDFLDSSIEQVIVDNDEVHEKAQDYMAAFMPRSKTKLVRYRERQPLFSRYSIETQIEGIYERRAQLPSGGSIVIDATEALTAIDVNSGRATKTADHDEAIYQVNVEAAAEVARQLRLRDIGGLVVVDFIDMRPRKHQRKLEKELRDALKADRARTTVGRISPNGLVEINRQRIKQSLRHRTHRPCPTCQGVGSIPNPRFAAQNLLGRLEARASTGLMESVVVVLHPEIADALQNGHRRELTELEKEFEMKIEVISSSSLTRTQERVDWTHRESVPAVKAKAEPALKATDIADDSGKRRQAAAGPEDDDEDVEERAEERPKRSGRGRRRRGNGAADGDAKVAAAEVKAAEPNVKAAEQKPKAAEQKARQDDERGDESKETPSRRRRRRSSRGRKTADNGQRAAGDQPEERKAEERKADEPKGEARTEGDAPRSRGRRRGPRRRPSTAGGGPREAAPREAAPREAAPRDGGQRPGGRRDFPPRDGAPRDFAPRDGHRGDDGRRSEAAPRPPREDGPRRQDAPGAGGDGRREPGPLAAAPPPAAAGPIGPRDDLASRLSRWRWWRKPTEDEGQ